MKVTLRKRNQGKKTSLYLDIYVKGKRKTESLKLYLVPNPKTKLERETNKKTLQLAQTICAKKQIELQNHQYNVFDDQKMDASFIKYIEKRMYRIKNKNYHSSHRSTLNYIQQFQPIDVIFKELNHEWLQEFKDIWINNRFH